jgi:hypothetical protein
LEKEAALAAMGNANVAKENFILAGLEAVGMSRFEQIVGSVHTYRSAAIPPLSLLLSIAFTGFKIP